MKIIAAVLDNMQFDAASIRPIADFKRSVSGPLKSASRPARADAAKLDKIGMVSLLIPGSADERSDPAQE